MSDLDEINYTRTEIRSYLPTGWRLAGESETGSWDAEGRVWSATVRDGSDFDWPLEVPLAEARNQGRLEALRQRLEALKLGGAHRARLR